MKTILTRTLMVTLLATSISAFAKSGDEKGGDARMIPTNVTQQTDCSRVANDAAKQDEPKSSTEQKIEQQDKEWLQDLQTGYGG
jgi:hypothetical protein